MGVAQRMTKVIPLEELSAHVHPGETVALGGAWMTNHPMAAVRQLIRDGIGDLHILGSLSSIDVDLLIAAGLVRELTFSMVSLEAYGLAPHFRKAVQDGSLAINEVSGVAINVGIDAGARKVPYLPMRGLGGSQLPELAPGNYAAITCPFTGDELLAVRAAGRVVITCEELVETGEIAANPATTHIPGFLVEAVIEAPFGAHPCSHIPRYGFDAWAIMDYADLCGEGGGPAFLEQLAAESEADYRSRVLDDDRRAVLTTVVRDAPTLEAS
jgi:glutaconate CoA-transferase subunit A